MAKTQNVSNLLPKYLRAFEKLNIDRSRGIAPHKPILLLSVLQLYHNYTLTTPKVYLSPELIAVFKTNWSLLVTSAHDCRISYPFYYLKSDKFWSLVPKPGFQNVDKLGSLVKNISQLHAAVECALLTDEIFQLVTDPKSNLILQNFLLNHYFPHSKDNFHLSEQENSKLIANIEFQILHEPPSEYQNEIKRLLALKQEEDVFLRGSLFKREIPKIYNNTCCISGMKINSIANASLIDACHIIPFSSSFNDTITNGIALCPNLHRAFDRGFISVDQNYRVIVSDAFEESNSAYSIKAFAGTPIKLPISPNYRPSLQNFEWHRHHVFK